MTKMHVMSVIVGIVIIAVIIVASGCFGINKDTEWVVVQPMIPAFGGDIHVVDRGGVYWKGFAKTWTWPKFAEFSFTLPKEGEDGINESVRVTFNDGGQADMSNYMRIQLPTEVNQKIEFNRLFSGNFNNFRNSVLSHLINAEKQTAPLMSASEHQMARKAEYRTLVEKQLKDGLYKMKKVRIRSLDETDSTGDSIMIDVTEIINDDNGIPIIDKESPFSDYGIIVTQFSITGTEYDPKTRDLFNAKKEAKLLMEQAKAEREREVQERLKVEERGLREKAEMEAKANVERAEAIIKAEKEKEMAEIEAQRKVEVEKQAKLEAETRLEKELAIAEKQKTIAETIANQKLEVAKLEKAEAIEKASAIIALAEAESKRIQMAGAITEEKKILAEIQKETAIGVAKELSKITSPASVIIGGGSGEQSPDITTSLINLKLLESTGLLEKTKTDVSMEVK